MLLTLSLAGWSLLVAAASAVVALAGFLVTRSAIRTERDDRRQAMSDAWAREWAAQRPLVYPRLPSDTGTATGDYFLKLKNGGRGPALNVRGQLRVRRDEKTEEWGDLSAGAIAARDEEAVRIAGPRLMPPWAHVSGELRYSDLVNGIYLTRFDFYKTYGGGLELVLHEHRSTCQPLPKADQRLTTGRLEGRI